MSEQPFDALPSEFRAISLLGAGAFGRVYRARDAADRPVAVKVLDARRAGDPAIAWQFQSEYRKLTRLEHPAFARAYAEGRTPDNVPYYSMALVEGAALAGPLEASRVRAVLVALARALVYLHGSGWVHGDLKPENVRQLPDGRLMILDVGLMAPAGQRREAIAGTLEYLAPEAWRLAPYAPASDLYALGAIAYELWCGRAPFAGDPMTLLRAHLQSPPPSVHGQDADPALAALIHRLLAKDPGARPDAWELLEALGEAMPAERPVALLGGELVGREPLLDAWREALATHDLLVVQGDEGLGKSRLLEAFRLEALLADHGWISASCTGDTPAAPWRAVVAQALAAAGQAPGPLVEAWLTGRVGDALLELEPAARKVAFQTAALEALDEAATALGGVAIAFDDWQRADSASQELLALWRRLPHEAPIAMAIASREAIAETTPHLLTPFSPDDVARYAASRLGSAPDAALLERLAIAEGHPRMLDLVLEHLASSGQLRREGAGWRIEAAPSAAMPEGLTALFAARYAGLSPDARRVAAVAALALPAGELAPPELIALTKLNAAAARDALEALSAAGVLTGGARVKLAVRAARAFFLQGVEPDTLTRWASPLARMLTGGDPAALPLDTLAAAARLALDGVDATLAVTLASAAAERFTAMGAAQEARTLLVAASARLTEAVPVALQLAVRANRAEAERLSDRLDDALASYAEALAQVGDARALHAKLLVGLGKCRQLKADYDGALAAYGEAEAIAEGVDGAQQARAVVSAARVRAFHGEAAEALTLAERAGAIARAHGAQAVLAQALNLQGYLLAQTAPERAEEAFARLGEAIALSERLGDRVGLGLALDNLGNASLALGDLAGAASAFARYADNCRTLGLDTELIVARLNGALVAAEKGDPAALETARAVAERATRLGRHFVAAAAKTAEAQALQRAGHVQAALAPLDEALAIAERIQNRLLEEHVRAYRVEAYLWLGDREAAEREAGRLEALVAASGHAEMAARLRVNRAELKRLAGDTPGAIQAAEALTADSNRVAAHRGWQLLALLRRDRAAAEAATAIARHWDAPWHLASDHLLEAHTVEPQAARRLAEAAIACAVNPYAAAGAALLLGELGAGLPAGALAPLEHALDGLDETTRRRVLDAHGLAALAIAPVPVATGLDVRRYAQWVEAVAMSEDEAAIARCALEGAIDLVSADRGYLLTYEDGRLKKALTKGLDYETEVSQGFSRSIVEHALFTAQPVYSANASEDAAWQEARSVMAMALRTVVCLPLLTPTSLLGAIYLDREAVEPLLAEEDLALLAAFATTAAGAIVRERARLRADLGRATLQSVAGRLLVGQHEALAGALLEAAVEAADAECAFYLVPEGDDWRAIAGRARAGRALAYRDGMASRGVLAHVRDTGEGFTVLDLAEAEGWQARESVQALGLRTVWCLPVGTPDGALVYLDTTRIAIADPARVLQALETLVGFCRPLLESN